MPPFWSYIPHNLSASLTFSLSLSPPPSRQMGRSHTEKDHWHRHWHRHRQGTDTDECAEARQAESWCTCARTRICTCVRGCVCKFAFNTYVGIYSCTLCDVHNKYCVCVHSVRARARVPLCVRARAHTRACARVRVCACAFDNQQEAAGPGG